MAFDVAAIKQQNKEILANQSKLFAIAKKQSAGGQQQHPSALAAAAEKVPNLPPLPLLRSHRSPQLGFEMLDKLEDNLKTSEAFKEKLVII